MGVGFDSSNVSGNFSFVSDILFNVVGNWTMFIHNLASNIDDFVSVLANFYSRSPISSSKINTLIQTRVTIYKTTQKILWTAKHQHNFMHNLDLSV